MWVWVNSESSFSEAVAFGASRVGKVGVGRGAASVVGAIVIPVASPSSCPQVLHFDAGCSEELHLEHLCFR